MTGFHDIRFPLDISLGSSGGPERRTDIVILASGHEERNAQWEASRRRYNAGYGMRSLDDIHKIIHFFECRRGRLYGFRWRDPMDWKSCPPSQQPTALDHAIATGDGSTLEFQLIKIYQSPIIDPPVSSAWERIITKPVSGTVKIAIEGSIKTESVHFSVDYLTGKVVFFTQHKPLSGQKITAGFEFDVPVRFDTDYLEIDIAAFRAGQIPQIDLVEIKS